MEKQEPIRNIPLSLQINYGLIRQEYIVKQLKKSGLSDPQIKKIEETFSENKLSFQRGYVNDLIMASIIRMTDITEIDLFLSITSSDSFRDHLNSSADQQTALETFSKKMIRKRKFKSRDWVDFITKMKTGNKNANSNFLSKLDIKTRHALFSILLSEKWINDTPIAKLAIIFNNNIENTDENKLKFCESFKKKFNKLMSISKDPKSNIFSIFAESVGASMTEKISLKNICDLCYKVIEFSAKNENLNHSLSKPVIPTSPPERVVLDSKFTIEHSSMVNQEIVHFDITKPHTIDPKKYLSNRVPETVLIELRKAAAAEKSEVFIGSSEDMNKFYHPLVYTLSLNSPTSTTFSIFTNPDDPKDYKIIIGGITSKTRLNHQMLQFRFAGFSPEDITKIRVRGSFDNLYTNELEYLRDSLKEFQGIPIVCFFGGRWFPMAYISKKIHPDIDQGNDEASLAKLYNTLNPKRHTTASLNYDLVKVSQEDGSEIVLMGLRMPNGSYAGKVTDQLLKYGVNSLIMMGAGGSLSSESGVGSYQFLKSSVYYQEEVTLSSEEKITPDFTNTTLLASEDARNITVDSPLVETKEWLDTSKSFAKSVDVETFHIMKSIVAHNTQHPDNKAKIVAGIFNSDVVGDHPLEEKIDANNAYIHLEPFVDCSLSALNVKLSIKREKLGGGGSK